MGLYTYTYKISAIECVLISLRNWYQIDHIYIPQAFRGIVSLCDKNIITQNWQKSYYHFPLLHFSSSPSLFLLLCGRRIWWFETIWWFCRNKKKVDDQLSSESFYSPLSYNNHCHVCITSLFFIYFYIRHTLLVSSIFIYIYIFPRNLISFIF